MKIKIVLIVGLLCVGSLTGMKCATTQTSTAIKSEGVLIVTVDSGMKAWAMWVNAGHANAVQVNQVENAYNDYYTAQTIAEAALLKVASGSSTNTADVVTASTAVTAAENQLLTLLNSYIAK